MLKKIIYVKYSELTLKKKNRMDFIRKLFQNLKCALKDFSVQINYYYDYLTIKHFDDKDLDKIFEILKLVTGINSFGIANEIDKNIDSLLQISNNIANELVKNNNVSMFRITCRRQDKSFMSSPEIISLIARDYINKLNLKVDLENFDFNLQIEVKKDCILVFEKFYKGSNGLPVGISGKTLVLLSGGIDSPVASRLLMERGLSVDFITFITPPHTSEQALQKVRDLIKIITLDNRLCKSKLYICNFLDVQQELAHIKKESYRITLMRRQFFNIAKQIAEKNKISAIATGESLGQVASQTIESMSVISEKIGSFLVFRPLITMNKEEIIKVAKRIGTYDISILPYDDSCSLFAPKNPVTKPNLETAIELEKKCFILEDIAKKVIETKIKIEEFVDGKYQ